MTDAHDIISQLVAEDYEKAVRARADFEETELAKHYEWLEKQKKEEQEFRRKIDLWKSENAKLFAQYERARKSELSVKAKMNQSPLVIKYKVAQKRRRKISNKIPYWVRVNSTIY